MWIGIAIGIRMDWDDNKYKLYHYLVLNGNRTRIPYDFLVIVWYYIQEMVSREPLACFQIQIEMLLDY